MTEEISTPKTIPNALFVCSRCRKLCIATELSWNATAMSSRRMTFSTKTPRSINLYYGPEYQWEHIDIFNKDKEIITKHQNSEFPICNKCANLKIDQICSQKDYYKYEIEQVQKNEAKFTLENIKNIKHKTAKLNTEIQVYKEVFASSNVSTEIRTDTIAPVQSEDEIFHVERRESVNPKANANEKLIVSTLMSGTTFVIGSNGHYGTINELRLGNMTPTPVPLEEINSGLMILCQLLNYYITITRALQITIRLCPEITFTLNDTEYVLSAFDLKHKKTTKRFNDAMNMIFTLFSYIFAYFEAGQPRPPFMIKPKLKQIGGEPYEYEIKHPEKWTLAMKYLLADIKSAQIQGLRLFVINNPN